MKSRLVHDVEIDGKSLKIFIQEDSEVENPGESQPTTQSSGLSGFPQLQKKSDKEHCGEKHDDNSSRAFTAKVCLYKVENNNSSGSQGLTHVQLCFHMLIGDKELITPSSQNRRDGNSYYALYL